MPKATKIPGLTDYGEDDNAVAPPKQTVFPKSQGGGAAPSPPAKETSIPGLKDYGGDYITVKHGDSQGDGTWSGLWHDITNPQAADLGRPQTWRDWITKTYDPSISDVDTAALDDVSFGTADYLRSKATGENIKDLRARTADAQAAMGPLGPVVNAATYMIPGAGAAKGLEAIGQAGKVAGVLGRYGASALEGGAASGTSSVGHQAGGYIDPLKVAKDTAWGTVGGAMFQGLGDAAAAAGQRVANYVTGKGGRASEQWPGGTSWRERAASNDPTLPDDISLYQKTLPPDDPAQPALSKTRRAFDQSIEPGLGFNTIATGTGAAASALGVNEGLNWAEAITPGGVAGFTTKKIGEPLARGVNTIDRNINVGQSLDQLYPALTQNPASVTDTSGWANALRRGWIGGERPDQGVAQGGGGAQWW